MGIPPASPMSLATKRPPGFRSAMCGVRWAISAKSRSVNEMPHSWAMAGRCRAAFVEPPVAATTAAAFSKDFLVTMSRGRNWVAIRRTTVSPEATA